MGEMARCGDLLKLAQGVKTNDFLTYPTAHLYNKIKVAVLDTHATTSLPGPAETLCEHRGQQVRASGKEIGRAHV